MKKLKKCLAASLATLLAGTMIGSMGMLTSSAATLGDVDGDGTISVSDVVTLNKCLNGLGALQDYSVADTNVNGIIDSVDASILLSFIVGKVTSLPYTKG